MFLNHYQITERLNQGLISNPWDMDMLAKSGIIQKYDKRAVNPASLDIHLGHLVLVEEAPVGHRVISYRDRERLAMREVDLRQGPLVLRPGQFILAATVERLAMPNDLACLLRIKSSLGRIGFEHLDAGWVDPGFEGALTLEYKNLTEHHSIELQWGDPIGQLCFAPVERLQDAESYKTVGRYGGHASVEQIK